jgi:hypothetical protein
MSMYKNVAAVMAKNSSLVTPFNFSILSYLILFTHHPCFLVLPSLCVYLSQNCLMYIYSQEKTITHYCFTKLFISLYFAVLYFFRTN